MKNNPLIKEMKTDIIPWLENVIIRKEKEHIKKLEAQKEKILNPPFYRRLLPGYNFFFQPVLKKVEDLIESNKKELNFYQNKLTEYKNWVAVRETA